MGSALGDSCCVASGSFARPSVKSVCRKEERPRDGLQLPARPGVPSPDRVLARFRLTVQVAIGAPGQSDLPTFAFVRGAGRARGGYT